MQVFLALAGNVALLVVPVFRLIVDPQSPQPLAVDVGGRFGWLALVPALTAALGLAYRRLGTSGLVHVTPALVTVVPLAACSVAGNDGDNWRAFQTLAVGWAVMSVVMGWLGGRRLQMSTGLLGCVLLLLAWRALAGNLWIPWWSASVVLAVGVSWAGVAVVGRSAAWAFAAGLCTNMATTVTILCGPWTGPADVGMLVLVAANTAVAGVVALIWQACRRMAGTTTDNPGPLLRIQVLLAVIGCLMVLAAAATFLIWNPIFDPAHPPLVVLAAGPWGTLALIPTALAVWSLRRFLPGNARGHLIAAYFLCAIIVTAFQLAAWDDGNFLAYHTLLSAPAIVGIVLLLQPRLVERTGSMTASSTRG